METRSITALRPHLENARIYGDHADSELIESIRARGVLNPLLITYDNRIISGHRRYDAARELGLAEVPVVVFGSDDELDILEALVESNKQREKNGLIIGREYQVLKRVINERASRQGANNQYVQRKSESASVNQLTEAPPTRKAAAQLGVSHETANRAARVVDAADRLRADGKERAAKQLEVALSRNVKKTYEQAKEAGYLAPVSGDVAVSVEESARDYITLADWQQMTEAEQWSALNQSGAATFNKQDTDHIEWALWSWNPVTGCRHTCSYCYARDIANHRFPQRFEPTFHPARLAAPFNSRVPADATTQIGLRNVFTCSMADLFGRWVPDAWIQAVLAQVRAAPQWNFLFLTKFPLRMAEFEFPDNAWVGTSVDLQVRVAAAEKAFRNVRAKVKWLSCEPLLEPLHFTDLSLFQWIVLGGASASTQTPEWRPPTDWWIDVRAQARAAGVKVYMKTNLLEREREYPGGESNAKELPASLRYLARD